MCFPSNKLTLEAALQALKSVRHRTIAMPLPWRSTVNVPAMKRLATGATSTAAPTAAVIASSCAWMPP